MLETAGRYWVAKRITNGVYSISNIYSIETEWDEVHPRLVAHAIEMGWTKSAADFNFARDYGDYWTKNSKNPGNMQIRRNTTLSCLRNEFHQISPATMMKISRNHLEGTIVAPRWGAAEPFWSTPCMHDSAGNGYHTAASMVAHLRADGPAALRQVYWASFSNPCSNLFKPFYLHGPKVPANYGTGTSTYSADSPWWLANRVKLLCDLNHPALAPSARAVFDQTEIWETGRQETVEAKARALFAQGKESDAVALLQEFVSENCARADREYGMLNQTLPVTLETVGLKYLFLDYVRQWTTPARVPLPLN